MGRALVLAATLVAALAGGSSAFACGTGGYSYAGLAARSPAFGIVASVTPLGPFDVVNGHVAGWVGVGGPGRGVGGSDEWLQVGLASFAGASTSSLYYELTRPGMLPTFHQLAASVPVGKPVRVAVLEMRARANWWRVWVDGNAATDPIYLPGSHRRWAPIATAESWDGNTGGTCNGFLFRFHDVSIAAAPGGGWRPLAGAFAISETTTRVRQDRAGGSFLAAEGAAALRSLASVRP